MPCSSRARTRLASVNRGGGWVKCCVGVTPRESSMSAFSSTGSGASASLSLETSSLSSRYRRRKPGNLITEPVERKSYTAPERVPPASMSTVVASSSASDIWLATIRRQIRSYRRRCSDDRCRPTDSGSRLTEVGLMASWASCAPLTRFVNMRARSGA